MAREAVLCAAVVVTDEGASLAAQAEVASSSRRPKRSRERRSNQDFTGHFMVVVMSRKLELVQLFSQGFFPFLLRDPRGKEGRRKEGGRWP